MTNAELPQIEFEQEFQQKQQNQQWNQQKQQNMCARR